MVVKPSWMGPMETTQMTIKEDYMYSISIRLVWVYPTQKFFIFSRSSKLDCSQSPIFPIDGGDRAQTAAMFVFKASANWGELHKNRVGYTALPSSRSLLKGNLSTRVFETRTATGSELFSLLTCLYTTTVTSPSIFSLLETISIKLLGTPLSWNAKCSLPVGVRVSKTRVVKLPKNKDGEPDDQTEK